MAAGVRKTAFLLLKMDHQFVECQRDQKAPGGIVSKASTEMLKTTLARQTSQEGRNVKATNER